MQLYVILVLSLNLRCWAIRYPYNGRRGRYYCPPIHDPICAGNGVNFVYFENQCHLDVRNYQEKRLGHQEYNVCPVSRCYPQCKSCPNVDDPVCVIDGRTQLLKEFKNPCEVEFAACSFKKYYRFLNYGKCPKQNECSSFRCSPDYRPICVNSNSMHREFSNDCEFQRSICENHMNWQTVKLGPCFARRMQGQGDRNELLEPVCASYQKQNRTFESHYELQTEMEKTGKYWSILHSGYCQDRRSCRGEIIKPICAKLNTTTIRNFLSPCHLQEEKTKSGKNWVILYQGLCRTSTTRFVEPTSVTEDGGSYGLEVQGVKAERMTSTDQSESSTKSGPESVTETLWNISESQSSDSENVETAVEETTKSTETNLGLSDGTNGNTLDKQNFSTTSQEIESGILSEAVHPDNGNDQVFVNGNSSNPSVSMQSENGDQISLENPLDSVTPKQEPENSDITPTTTGTPNPETSNTSVRIIVENTSAPPLPHTTSADQNLSLDGIEADAEEAGQKHEIVTEPVDKTPGSEQEIKLDPNDTNNETTHEDILSTSFERKQKLKLALGILKELGLLYDVFSTKSIKNPEIKTLEHKNGIENSKTVITVENISNTTESPSCSHNLSTNRTPNSSENIGTNTTPSPEISKETTTTQNREPNNGNSNNSESSGNSDVLKQVIRGAKLGAPWSNGPQTQEIGNESPQNTTAVDTSSPDGIDVPFDREVSENEAVNNVVTDTEVSTPGTPSSGSEKSSNTGKELVSGLQSIAVNPDDELHIVPTEGTNSSPTTLEPFGNSDIPNHSENEIIIIKTDSGSPENSGGQGEVNESTTTPSVVTDSLNPDNGLDLSVTNDDNPAATTSSPFIGKEEKLNKILEFLEELETLRSFINRDNSNNPKIGNGIKETLTQEDHKGDVNSPVSTASNGTAINGAKNALDSNTSGSFESNETLDDSGNDSSSAESEESSESVESAETEIPEPYNNQLNTLYNSGINGTLVGEDVKSDATTNGSSGNNGLDTSDSIPNSETQSQDETTENLTTSEPLLDFGILNGAVSPNPSDTLGNNTSPNQGVGNLNQNMNETSSNKNTHRVIYNGAVYTAPSSYSPTFNFITLPNQNVLRSIMSNGSTYLYPINPHEFDHWPIPPSSNLPTHTGHSQMNYQTIPPVFSYQQPNPNVQITQPYKPPLYEAVVPYKSPSEQPLNNNHYSVTHLSVATYAGDSGEVPYDDRGKLHYIPDHQLPSGMSPEYKPYSSPVDFESISSSSSSISRVPFPHYFESDYQYDFDYDYNLIGLRK